MTSYHQGSEPSMTTQRYEIEAWLGDDWSPEQTEQIITEYQAWERQHPDVDGEDTQAMLTAIAQRVDGTLDLRELARERLRTELAAVEARRQLRAGVLAEIAGGMSEVEAARLGGVDRMTVRAWRGKR
jgi:hypothetical protein